MHHDSLSALARTLTGSVPDGACFASAARKHALRPSTTARILENRQMQPRRDRIQTETRRVAFRGALAPSP